VRTACQVVWTDGDVSRIGEFYAENFQANYPMTDWGTGLEGAKGLALEIRAAFPDYRERIDELIDAGDRIIVRLTIQGTHQGDYGLFINQLRKRNEEHGLDHCRCGEMYLLRELSGGMPFPFTGNEDREFSSHPKRD